MKSAETNPVVVITETTWKSASRKVDYTSLNDESIGATEYCSLFRTIKVVRTVKIKIKEKYTLNSSSRIIF